MRIYEELFIVRPDATDEEIDAYVDQVTSVITSAGGTVDKVEKWGVRRLAYQVEKRNEGSYILVQFTAGPTVAREVERRMRVTDLVIKFLTVRIDEKLKKIEKRRKQREKRAKRRPAPAAAPAAAAPGAPAPGTATPGAPTPGAPVPGAPSSEPEPEPVAESAPAEAGAQE